MFVETSVVEDELRQEFNVFVETKMRKDEHVKKPVATNGNATFHP